MLALCVCAERNYFAQATYLEAKEYFLQAEQISPGFWKNNQVSQLLHLFDHCAAAVPHTIHEWFDADHVTLRR
jgi:hypothetical protein